MCSNHEELDGDYKIDEQVLSQTVKFNQEVPNVMWERQKAQSTSCLDLSTVNPEVDRLRCESCRLSSAFFCYRGPKNINLYRYYGY